MPEKTNTAILERMSMKTMLDYLQRFTAKVPNARGSYWKVRRENQTITSRPNGCPNAALDERNWCLCDSINVGMLAPKSAQLF